MRKDPSLQLRPGIRDGGMAVGGGGYSEGASLSGHERNHLFLNDHEGGLRDASGLSGLDAPGDGRAVAWLDHDSDGWLDFVVANANAPTFQLYRNEMSALPAARDHRSIRVAVRGGNQTAGPTSDWSNRDGIGARIEVQTGDQVLLRERRAGEGLAAQNSSITHIGIGSAPHAEEVRVYWPSGKTQRAQNVPAGTLVTFHEDPAQSDSASGIEITTPPASRSGSPSRVSSSPARTLRLSEAAGQPASALRVLLTTATWCEACRSEIPDVARLRGAFSAEELELIAIPTDESDTTEKLDEYVRRHAPKYRMLYERTKTDIDQVEGIIESTLRRRVLPAAVVTDRDNRVLGVYWGLPTISDIRALQEQDPKEQ